jgi:DNA-binding NtrC family response regulator
MAKTILIVDDSISLRTVVKIALERAGYRCWKPPTACRRWRRWRRPAR